MLSRSLTRSESSTIGLRMKDHLLLERHHNHHLRMKVMEVVDSCRLIHRVLLTMANGVCGDGKYQHLFMKKSDCAYASSHNDHALRKLPRNESQLLILLETFSSTWLKSSWLNSKPKIHVSFVTNSLVIMVRPQKIVRNVRVMKSRVL